MNGPTSFAGDAKRGPDLRRQFDRKTIGIAIAQLRGQASGRVGHLARHISHKVHSEEYAAMDKSNPKPPSLTEEIFAELEAEGIIRRNGEYRNGKPVFVLTETRQEVPSRAVPRAIARGSTMNVRVRHR